MTPSHETPYSGIYPALITPFTADGDVDVDKLATYVKYLVAQGEVDGLFVCGSYGSSPIMTPDQRKLVVETALAHAGGQLRILAHIGGPDSETTLDLAHHAQSAGVDALAAITPFYYRHHDEDVESSFLELLEHTNAALFLYNNPKYTNFSTPPHLLARLAEAGLAGVKDSSGDISVFYSYMEAVDQDDFTFLIGSQTLLLPALAMGGHGCVSGLSNAFPGLIRSIYDTFRAGETDKAAELQRTANSLRRLTGSGIPVPFYHAVLPMLGVDIGSPRRPFRPLPQSRVEELHTQLGELDLLPR